MLGSLSCILSLWDWKLTRKSVPSREKQEPEKMCPLARSAPQTLGIHQATEPAPDQTSLCSCLPGSPPGQLRDSSHLTSLNPNTGPALQIGPSSCAPSFRAWPHYPTSCTHHPWHPPCPQAPDATHEQIMSTLPPNSTGIHSLCPIPLLSPKLQSHLTTFGGLQNQHRVSH